MKTLQITTIFNFPHQGLSAEGKLQNFSRALTSQIDLTQECHEIELMRKKQNKQNFSASSQFTLMFVMLQCVTVFYNSLHLLLLLLILLFLLIAVWSNVRHRLRCRGGSIISLVCETGSISIITSHQFTGSGSRHHHAASFNHSHTLTHTHSVRWTDSGRPPRLHPAVAVSLCERACVSLCDLDEDAQSFILIPLIPSSLASDETLSLPPRAQSRSEAEH